MGMIIIFAELLPNNEVKHKLYPDLRGLATLSGIKILSTSVCSRTQSVCSRTQRRRELITFVQVLKK